MLLQRIPLLRSRKRPKSKGYEHSLVRNVLVTLLLTSLLPILLIGILNTFRSRETLRSQVSGQLESILTHEINQLTDYVDAGDKTMDRLVTDEEFNNNLLRLLNNAPDTYEHLQAQAYISFDYRTKPQTAADDFFNQMFILRPDGSVALATNEPFITQNFGGNQVQDAFVRDLIGTNKALLSYGPLPSYSNQVVLFVTRSFVDEKGTLLATMVAIASSNLTYQTITDPRSFLAGTTGYYYNKNGELFGLSESSSLTQLPKNPGVTASLKTIVNNPSANSLFKARTYNGNMVTGHAKWLSDLGIGLALVTDDMTVIGPSSMVDPLTMALLVFSLAISASLIYYSSSQFVNPLVQLANAVDRFAKGNWSERVHINRKDEIGLLATSFNHMADDLSELYQSLEGVVDKRTGQLRIASEVAQLATSTSKLSDTLGRTVALIAERFGFYHVAIYLFDETRENLVLHEASGASGEAIKRRGDHIETNSNTLVSWTVRNVQAKFITDVTEDPLYRPHDLLPDTRSEVAIPITLGNEVLGALDIQSTLNDAFDTETIAVFQTLANQISSTLQSTRLLESTQITYHETALLYHATRQVTQAHNETEIIQYLADTFIQLPLIGSILSVEGDIFKILVVTDAKSGRIEKSLQSLRIPIGRMVHLLTENRVVLVEDISQPNDYDNLLSFLLRRGCKSAAMVSVIENGRLAKVLVLGSREANQITQNGLQPYVNLAEVISASLEKFRVLNTLQQRLSELQILASFSQAISAETDLNNLYRVLHEQVMQTMGTDLEFAVALYNAEKQEVQFPYAYENRQVLQIEPVPLGTGLTSMVIQNQQPMLLRNRQEIEVHTSVHAGDPANSWLGVPLVFAGKVIGVVIVQDLVNEGRFTQDDVNLFMTLAPQIATAVRNTQLYTETQQALSAYDQERFLFNTLLDNIPEGISVKDTHGRYIRVSESVARIYQMSANDLVGKTYFDLAEHDRAEELFSEEQLVMNIGRPEIGLIEHIPSRNGQEVWLQTSRIPIRSHSGDPYGLLVIQRDITEIKQAEALAQRRAEHVVIAAEIARDTTGTLDVNELLEKSINLVRERFGYYHASVFLLDAAGEYAVLRESTGSAGQQMKQAGHRLAVGSKSIVGQATSIGHALIVNDVTSDPTHLPNPLLPETRSELSIPLKVGERVLGALDVQSTKVNAFVDEDVSVLEILADQLAVAVVNGDLFAKTQELLGKHRLLRQISIAASSSISLEDALSNVVSGLLTARVGDRIAILMLNEEGMLQIHASAGYEGTQHRELRVAPGQGITGMTAIEKRPIRVDNTLNDPRYVSVDAEVRSELAIPILFSDELLGVLNLESTQTFAFDENDQEILGALGNNLGGVIANIRLIEQVRKQVLRERQLFEITSAIRRSVDPETILETSIKELARAVGARKASIRITAGADTGSMDLNTVQPIQNNNGRNRNNGNQSYGAGKMPGMNGKEE